VKLSGCTYLAAEVGKTGVINLLNFEINVNNTSQLGPYLP